MRGFGGGVTLSELKTEVQMTRQIFTGSLILVEGGSDLKRFQDMMVDDSFQVIICWSKGNTLGLASYLDQKGDAKYVALVDSDFDRVTGNLTGGDHVVYSEFHDFDADIFYSGALNRYIRHISVDGKSEITAKLRGEVESMVLKPSVARYLNESFHWCVAFSESDIERAFDGEAVSFGRWVAKALQKSENPKIGGAELIGEVEKWLISNDVGRQLYNGHDLCSVLGLRLRSAPFSRHKSNSYGKEIEMHLRLSMSNETVRGLGFWKELETISEKFELGLTA